MNSGTTTGRPIERRSRLGNAEFRENYLKPHIPVIVTDAIDHWSATKTWTPDFFRTRFGDRLVRVDRQYRLAEYIDLVEQSSPDRPAPYLFHLFLDENFPELLGDFQPWPEYLTPNWLGTNFLPGAVGRRIADHDRPGVFIGGRASTCANLHYDFQYHSFSFQLFGTKRFWLYPTDQTPSMYPDPANKCLSLVKNVEKPDLARFPMFAQASPWMCDLAPGEMIFIPGGWWHTTRMLSTSISISVNTANATNWPAVVRELHSELRPRHPVLASPFAAYMRLVGSWKGRKDGI
jgi:hypothetical protein